MNVIEKTIERFNDGERCFQLEMFMDDSPDRRYTNTFELYDAIPMFVYGRGKKELPATATANEMTREVSFKYAGQQYLMQQTAATITRTFKNADGKHERYNVAIFPGKREEMVQYAIFKFAADDKGTTQTTDDRGKKIFGVGFTLYGIQKELEKYGRTYNTAEIKEAIDILNASMPVVSAEGQGARVFLKESVFPKVVYRSKYGEDQADHSSPDVSYVRFNTLANRSIENMTSRHLTYEPLMLSNNCLTRYLLKRMADRNKGAEIGQPYRIRLKTLICDSGNSWDEKRIANNGRRGHSVGEELLKLGVADRYELVPLKHGRRIEDYDLFVYPSPSSVRDTKRANRRRKEAVAFAETGNRKQLQAV